MKTKAHSRSKWRETVVLLFSVLLFLIVFSCGNVKTDAIVQAQAELPEDLDFNFHVKPILSDKCYACHGPDKENQKADLRLDTPEGAIAALTSGAGYAIVPGNLSKSQAFLRMTSDDPEMVMPPPEAHLTMTTEEIATIAAWIEQGAVYKPHWSFIAPQKVALPKEVDEEWVKNEIDYFISAKVKKVGLENNAEADKETLIRRLSFDLRGIPPTLAEVDAFLADESENAYEKLVDSFLASMDTAERLTLEWLDVARYADSHGLHSDGPRTMWPWRDWVINAFHSNMPHDQFITEQLAGDLLPNATKKQILATAFQRNHPMSAEGGIIDEEFRLSYVMDRATTASRAFLGLTIECAQCHDHKYDPLSQKEFFQLSAFFNNMREIGMIGDNGNFGPELALTTAETDSIIAYVENQIEEKELNIAELNTDALDHSMIENFDFESISVRKPVAYFPFDRLVKVYNAKQEKEKFKAPNTYSEGQAIAIKNLTTLEGVKGKAFAFGGDEDFVNVSEVGDFEKSDPFSISLWVNLFEGESFQGIFSNTGNKNNNWRGYEILLNESNKVTVNLTSILPTNGIELETKDSIPTKEWLHMVLTYDGSSRAEGVKLYINSKQRELKTNIDNLFTSIAAINWDGHGNYKATRPLSFGKTQRAFGGNNGYLQGAIDEVKIYDATLSSIEVQKLYSEIRENETITPPSQQQIAAHILLTKNQDYKNIQKDLKALRDKHQSIYDTTITVMVQTELEEPRATFVLNRGAYDDPTEQVFPGTPDVLGEFPSSFPKNRLGLAQWLTSDENPIVARTIVNRYWQMIFGRGIVRTSEDLGNQGELPSHPGLLDWLAVDFLESDWNLKALLKTMVMSATYRQHSKGDAKSLEMDTENVLLSRGPRSRLQAEMIRDNALSASGLLVKKVGGKSVKPYQPEGLWKITSFSQLNAYIMDEGDDLYRKSMYTFIRRTVPPPNMSTFDAPNRSFCIVRRQKTVTPLQALVLLNDPQFVEMCRALADRMQREVEGDVQAQIGHGFRLLTGRHPSQEEVDILHKLYLDELDKFSNDTQSIGELNEVGLYVNQDQFDPAKTAALTMVSNVMMSHDETYIKR